MCEANRTQGKHTHTLTHTHTHTHWEDDSVEVKCHLGSVTRSVLVPMWEVRHAMKFLPLLQVAEMSCVHETLLGDIIWPGWTVQWHSTLMKPHEGETSAWPHTRASGVVISTVAFIHEPNKAESVLRTFTARSGAHEYKREIKTVLFINNKMSNLPYQEPAGRLFITGVVMYMQKMINMKVKIYWRAANRNVPCPISKRQNSGSESIHAVSYTVYEDICAAPAQAPNQVLGVIL